MSAELKWEKLGKIFDPRDHSSLIGCQEFAQSPQTLVFDDFIRIYFSTRQRDDNGKYLSHIAFVDVSKDLKEIIQVSNHNVLELGELGTFDEHGIFPINILKLDDRIFGYTCGWSRRDSVSVETSIGLVESTDYGKTFQRLGNGPIVTSSLNEPYLVGDAFVSKHNDTFHMWYIFGTKWNKFTPDSAPDRTYKIGHATSPDGITWEKEEAKQIIPDQLNEFESQALPTVLKFKNEFHMCFCYRESFDFRKNSSRGYRIGYAFSEDLTSWQRADDLLGLTTSENEWDSEMMCYPHLFSVENKTYLLYNGNEFGKYGFGAALLDG